MTPAEALAKVRRCARAGRYVVTKHARDKMKKRGITEADLRHALENAWSATWQRMHGTWRVPGPDIDGDPITVAVRFNDGVVVVTTWG